LLLIFLKEISDYNSKAAKREDALNQQKNDFASDKGV
jgi:hypothetical protein